MTPLRAKTQISLGRTIYLWRQKKKLTQGELAHLSQMSRPNLSFLEQGSREVTVETLRRLAHALGVQPGILVDGIAPNTIKKKRLSRESLDRIARSVVGERLGLSSYEKRISHLIQSIVKRKLGFRLKSGRVLPRTARSEKLSWCQAKAELDPADLNNLLSRMDKISQVLK